MKSIFELIFFFFPSYQVSFLQNAILNILKAVTLSRYVPEKPGRSTIFAS